MCFKLVNLFAQIKINLKKTLPAMYVFYTMRPPPENAHIMSTFDATDKTMNQFCTMASYDVRRVWPSCISGNRGDPSRHGREKERYESR